MIVNNLKNLYMDYLISSTQLVTCTDLSRILDKTIDYDKFIRLLSNGNFNSKKIWQQSKVVSQEINHSKHLKVWGFDAT